MKRAALPVFCVLWVVMATAQEPVSMRLWPTGAPGANLSSGPERKLPAREDPRGPITRITDVSDPTLTFYRVSKSQNTGAAVLVFPGGGYKWLSYDLEGTEVCEWLVKQGINCALVKYCVSESPKEKAWEQPLQDAQRAIGIVRQHTKEWGTDPERVGVLGFSAGAHVSAVLSNDNQQRSYDPIDDVDKHSCRPDFVVLIYPALFLRQDQSLSSEVNPTSGTPPTFIFQTEDDAYADTSLAYYAALKGVKVPAELHVYAHGGHGYGMRAKSNPAAGLWPDLVLKWLVNNGMVERK